MELDLLDCYEQASAWTTSKVVGAKDRLADATPNDGWDVRTLLNHMLYSQHYFLSTARGQQAPVPSASPPELLGDDPLSDFEQARAEVMRAFAAPGVIERTGPSLGIAFSDILLHGWDLARATDQDATMPDGLPAAAYQMVHGRFTDEQRKGVFKPEIPVAPDASAQDKLLAYTGRDPSAR
jgi:uncharacterized protein (TIGR03086 family)